MTTTTSNAQTQYGTGAPVAPAPNGTRYFDTTTNALGYVEYVCFGGVWFALQSSANASTILAPSTVAGLPAAAAGNLGWRGFVTDSTQTTTAGIGTTVVGGGANKNPVYSDGANWKIG